MKRVLIVKVTSLGDIVEALPVVADIKRAYPGVEVDWAADEAFAEVVHWSQSVDRVLCAPLRRFKKARRWGDFKAIWASIAELRAYRYDFIIDIHGVYKSAIIAFLARSSKRIGYQSKDLGERGAAFAYTGRFGPRPQCDAWHGMRISASEALGYEVEGPPVYNLRLPEPATAPFAADSRPVAALFHATSKDDKKWPVPHWVAVGRELAQRGFHVVLPWGSERERAEAEQIASAGAGLDRPAEAERDRNRADDRRVRAGGRHRYGFRSCGAWIAEAHGHDFRGDLAIAFRHPSAVPLDFDRRRPFRAVDRRGTEGD